VAALGATITSGHIEENRMDEMVLRVRSTAEEISGLLNYSPAHANKVVPLRSA
jgi:DNA-binding IclR family transcriptional regulator